MKNKGFLASRKQKIILLFSLAAAALILTLIIFLKKDTAEIPATTETDTTNKTSQKNEPKDLRESLDGSIDSILNNFGIKNQWITTEKKTSKAEWFDKSVLIPKDVTSAEVNLDISSYLNEAGLGSKVTEDILSKDITIYINNPDSTKKLPGAVIRVTHSDKVTRETGVIAIIMDKINEFSDEEIDKLVVSKNEFSYVFPRNLDDIDIQHKLLQHKKDIIINLTIGGKDNYEADFHTEIDDKAIHEKVRSFNADFPSINKVLLTKLLTDGSLNRLQNKIASELSKSNIRVINDTMLVNVNNINEKDKIASFFKEVIHKALLRKRVIVVYPIDKSEFDDFYNTVLTYKKLGYKFFNLTEFLNYAEEEKKREQLRLEKQKQEEQKKKKEEAKKKKPVEKPKTIKKPDKKEVPKSKTQPEKKTK